MKRTLFSIALLLPFVHSQMLHASTEIEQLLIDYKGKDGYKPILRFAVTDKRKISDKRKTLDDNISSASKIKEELSQENLRTDFFYVEDFTDLYYGSKSCVSYHCRTGEIVNKFENKTVIVFYLKSKSTTFLDMKFPSPKENDPKKITKRANIEENGLLKVALTTCIKLSEFSFELQVPEGYYFPATLEDTADPKDETKVKFKFTMKDILYQKATKWLKDDLIKIQKEDTYAEEVINQLPLDIETEKLFGWLNHRSAQCWKPVLEEAGFYKLNPGMKEIRNSRKLLKKKTEELKETQAKKIAELKAKKA